MHYKTEGVAYRIRQRLTSCNNHMQIVLAMAAVVIELHTWDCPIEELPGEKHAILTLGFILLLFFLLMCNRDIRSHMWDYTSSGLSGEDGRVYATNTAVVKNEFLWLIFHAFANDILTVRNVGLMTVKGNLGSLDFFSTIMKVFSNNLNLYLFCVNQCMHVFSPPNIYRSLTSLHQSYHKSLLIMLFILHTSSWTFL